MTRQRRTFVVLLVALVAAGAASYGVYQAISRVPAHPAALPTVNVVVAAKPMPVGTMLTAGDVKVVKWPADAALPGGFADANAVVGRGLIMPDGENEPLNDRKVAPREGGAGLPPAITPGMRAMSVKVDEVIGVAGFVVPGTRVDVLAIMQPPEERQQNSIAKVVVANVQVLTAGTRYDQEKASKEGKAIPSSVVTLLVTPDDAQRVALAQAEGKLMLALRNPLDTDTPELLPIATSGLLGMPGARVTAPVATTGTTAPPRAARRAAAPAVVPPPAPPKPYTVVAIRAAKLTEEVVR